MQINVVFIGWLCRHILGNEHWNVLPEDQPDPEWAAWQGWDKKSNEYVM